MFKFRVVGFILLMGILGGIFFWSTGGVWIFLAVAPALVGAAVGECCSMMERSGRGGLAVPCGIASWLLALGSMISMIRSEAGVFILLLTLMLIIAGCAGLLSMNIALMQKIFNSAGIMILFLPSFILFLATYFAGGFYGYWLLFICLATKATDTGGYITGTLTAKLPGGNHKIAPRVSPKKSWEGLIGGIILSLAVAWAFYYFNAQASLLWYLIAGTVLSLGSFFGDLTESAVKRLCEIKDSGSFVPGMGGAFDVLDSFIYNGILFWILFLFV